MIIPRRRKRKRRKRLSLLLVMVVFGLMTGDRSRIHQVTTTTTTMTTIGMWHLQFVVSSTFFSIVVFVCLSFVF